MIDDAELRQQYLAWEVISEARRAIMMAKQRVDPTEELCERLGSTQDPHELSRVVYALLERVGDQEHEAIIVDALHRISAEAEQRHYSERERLDRSTGRLMRALSPEISIPLAMEWGRHRTKRRRELAIKVFRAAPLSKAITEYLLERYDATRDVEFLKLILREPLSGTIDRRKLFEAFDGIDGGYWQARVAEAAMKAQPGIAEELCAERPHAFFWAVGRLGLVEHASLIVEALTRANDKLPLVGIAVWALGKLGAKAEILCLEPLVEELERTHPDPFKRSA